MKTQNIFSLFYSLSESLMLADSQATPAYQVLVSHLICKGLW